ncbi:MAG: flavin reductase family protein [Defluviitaleaceae bacterium]|nr:flavin reductase family protein [Defluviitaleaceae bacterium]
MKKSIPATNDLCPQTMFLYGTYKEDGSPNFGLFCWFSYYWDSELGVMACIGGEKLTKERIRATKVFSANLVTEELLPLADYWGNKNGHDSDKMDIAADVEKGSVLDVPVLLKSPWVYELEVAKSIPTGDGEVLLCKIKNVLVDEVLCDAAMTDEDKIKAIKPAQTVGGTYFAWDGNAMGKWGEPMEKVKSTNYSL